MARNLTSEEAKAMRAQVKNPGRKTRTEEEEIKAALRNAVPEADVLASLAAACKRKESWAVTLYLAYLWGKPVERVDLAGEGGGPVVIHVRLKQPGEE
jgi:hypothetical protein